jgi:hypothetical protein
MARSFVLLAAGGALLVLYLLGTLGLPEPPGVDASGREVAAYFAANGDKVRFSVWMLTLAGPAFVVVAAIIRSLLPRPHRDVYFGAALVVIAMTALSQWFLGGLALHADTLEPATGRTLFGIYAYYGPTLTGAVAAMAGAVGVAALAQGAFPRWLGWLSLVLVAEQVAESVTVFGDKGFDAPNGDWNLKLGAGLFTVWFVALLVCAYRRVAAEDAPGATR